MSPNSYAKQCGVCHAGGGQMEYDRDRNPYGDLSPTGDRYTYLNPKLSGGAAVAGGIVDIKTLTDKSTLLYGSNKMEVDCLLCHMQEIRSGAAWYTNSRDCAATGVGPADNPNCGTQKVVFMDMVRGIPTMMPDNRFTFSIGAIYDPFNRNIAISLGYFDKAASAGIGVGINEQTGALKNPLPATILGANIGASKSANCAVCHARNEADSIGLPGEAQVFGGMITGFGNYVRLYDIGSTFDWDKIDGTTGNCTTNCANTTRWMEFGCKTGMGKRSQKTGYGSQDRWSNGFCMICDTQGQWTNPQSFCGLPSVQATCIAKSGIATLISDNSPMTLVNTGVAGDDGPAMSPKLIPGKMPDTDVHDASSKGMTCASCHFTVNGATNTPRTISGGGALYTYPATSYYKMDHQMARGYSMLEQAGNETDGMVSCASCHIAGENNHPNAAALAAPIAGHAGFPSLHFALIDCRTCHIPAVYSYPGRLLFRDWTAGAYRQGEGSNGNANHFDFAMDMIEGSAGGMKPMKMWLTTPEGTKIIPALPSLLPTWTTSAVRASDGKVMGWAPAKTRDITAAVARVSAQHSTLGIRMNGTNDHPPFQGFHLTDPLKIESKEKIDFVAAELNGTGAGVATHAKVRDARINLFPIFFDPSHGIAPKTFALGAPSKGGCKMCHSSSNPASPYYSQDSVGFFDSEKEILQNGMMQMANADCDNPYMFTLITTGQTTTLATPTCIENHPMFPTTCNGYAPGTTSTGQQNGTMGLCKERIGNMLGGMMGMAPDPMLRMDGIEFMQMMAVKEGGTPAGCNPMMQIFFGPSATPVTKCMDAAAVAANGGNPFGYMYSREEIKLHYAKMIEQSFFAPEVAGLTYTAGGTVPATMGRVFGSVSIAQRDGSKKTWDLGATCYNPMDMTHNTTFPCSEAMPGFTNKIKTFIKANEMLGYTPDTLTHLMSINPVVNNTPLAMMSYSINNLTVTFSGANSQNASNYSWNLGDGTVVSGATASVTTHTYAAVGTKTVTLTVTSAAGVTNTASAVITLAAANNAPTMTTSVAVVNKVATITYNAIDSDATNTLRVFVNWGDGTGANAATGNSPLSGTISHTYSDGTYTAYVAVTDQSGGHLVNTVAIPAISTSMGSISGLISDGTNSLGGAVVTLYSSLTGAPVSAVFSASTPTTRPDYGMYTLSSIPTPSTYDIKVQMSGYSDAWVMGVVMSTPTATTINITMTPVSVGTLHNVSGTITAAPAGMLVQLIQHFTPTIFNPTGTVIAQQKTTDASGNYLFTRLPDGNYEVLPQPVSGHTTPTSVSFTLSGADVVVSTMTYTNP